MTTPSPDRPQFHAFIARHRRLLLTTHLNPDGDGLGSEAGWLGWHLTRATGGVLASQLHLDADRGALDLYLVR